MFVSVSHVLLMREAVMQGEKEANDKGKMLG